jgi:hypothetical protein
MSPRFTAKLDKIRHLAEAFNQHDLAVRKLVVRAFTGDIDAAADAIRAIERKYNIALAAVLWAFFWIRQSDLAQAQRELETVEALGKTESLWGGLALMMLGELYLEIGESKKGKALIRRATKVLDVSRDVFGN